MEGHWLGLIRGGGEDGGAWVRLRGGVEDGGALVGVDKGGGG